MSDPSAENSAQPAFTPGPWFLKRSGTIADRDTGQLVATTGYRTEPAGGGQFVSQDDANAALIAAAPQMFEALCWAERWLRRAMQTQAQAGAPLAAVLSAIQAATDVGGAA